MPGQPPQDSPWFEEFKKLNTGNPVGDATPTGSSASDPAGKRRKHNRFAIDGAQATLYPDGLLSVFGVGRSNRARAALDLSEGGVRFLTHERIAIGTKVRVVIQMEKYKDAIEATGMVKWCFQSARKPKDFFAGVQFADLHPAQARKISLMAEWFNSPQYKAVREAKLKQRRGNDIIFPK